MRYRRQGFHFRTLGTSYLLYAGVLLPAGVAALAWAGSSGTAGRGYAYERCAGPGRFAHPGGPS